MSFVWPAQFQGRGRITLSTTPGDFSEAAWYLLAGMVAKQGDVHLIAVGVHPERTTLLKYLLLMGAPIQMQNHRWIGSDPVADFHSAPPKKLFPLRVLDHDLPYLMKDLAPLLMALACAEGTSTLPYHPEMEPLLDFLLALGVGVEREGEKLQIRGRTSFNTLCYPSDNLLITHSLRIAKLHHKDPKHA